MCPAVLGGVWRPLRCALQCWGAQRGVAAPKWPGGTQGRTVSCVRAWATGCGGQVSASLWDDSSSVEQSRSWWLQTPAPSHSGTPAEHTALGVAFGPSVTRENQGALGRLPRPQDKVGRWPPPLLRDCDLVLRRPWPGVVCGLSLAMAAHWGQRNAPVTLPWPRPPGPGPAPGHWQSRGGAGLGPPQTQAAAGPVGS